MTKFLTWCFVFLWLTMGSIEVSNGDIFHTVTSFTIAAWNLSLLRDLSRLDKAVEKSDAQV